jgi:hypothetical protein
MWPSARFADHRYRRWRPWTRPGRECSRCGEFRFDAISGGLRSDTPWFSDRENDEMVRLSGWIREQNVAGNVPTLTDADVTRVIAIPRPDLRTRGMFALREIAKMDGALVGRYLANRQIVGNKKLLGVSYSLDVEEFQVLLQLLEHEKLVLLRINPEGLTLTVLGIMAVEKMAATGGEFTQGFVAMSFDPEFENVWTDGFEPAIRAAGYRPFRIDRKDYIGGITDEIIFEIRRSRFVVADYTEQVKGVYFEAGFGLGLGLCRRITNATARRTSSLSFIRLESDWQTLSNAAVMTAMVSGL